MKKEFKSPSAQFVGFCYSEQIAASGQSENTCMQVPTFTKIGSTYYTDNVFGCWTRTISSESQAALVWFSNVG